MNTVCDLLLGNMHDLLQQTGVDLHQKLIYICKNNFSLKQLCLYDSVMNEDHRHQFRIIFRLGTKLPSFFQVS